MFITLHDTIFIFYRHSRRSSIGPLPSCFINKFDWNATLFAFVVIWRVKNSERGFDPDCGDRSRASERDTPLGFPTRSRRPPAVWWCFYGNISTLRFSIGGALLRRRNDTKICNTMGETNAEIGASSRRHTCKIWRAFFVAVRPPLLPCVSAIWTRNTTRSISETKIVSLLNLTSYYCGQILHGWKYGIRVGSEEILTIYQSLLHITE